MLISRLPNAGNIHFLTAASRTQSAGSCSLRHPRQVKGANSDDNLRQESLTHGWCSGWRVVGWELFATFSFSLLRADIRRIHITNLWRRGNDAINTLPDDNNALILHRGRFLDKTLHFSVFI